MKKDTVFIVYKTIPSIIAGITKSRIVKRVVHTRQQALDACEELAKETDPMYGIQVQEWEMESERPEDW